MRRVDFFFTFLILSLCLCGCKNPVNQYTSKRYYDEGVKARDAGDYELAQKNFSKALLNSRLGGIDRYIEAQSLYEVARLTGYLGDTQKAEKEFLEVIELTKNYPEAESLKSPVLCELARLYFDTEQYEKSEPIFLDAMEALESSGIEKTDPIGYCIFLEDYRTALQKLGFKDQEEILTKQIETIRSANPGVRAMFVPKRYK